MRWTFLALAFACRDYQDPAPFVDCQPYQLECVGCTYTDDLAELPADLRRAYRCEDVDGAVFDAVERIGPEATIDTHFYDPETGYRSAALREYDESVDVCGRDLDVEWYGLIIEDCEPLCELEPALPEADPGIPGCTEIQ